MALHPHTIFGISFPESQLKHVDDVCINHTSIDEYDDYEIYETKEVYTAELDDDTPYKFKYIVEAYRNSEQNKTEYALYLVPMFETLSEKKKKDVAYSDDEDADVIDIHQYGYNILMDSETHDGDYEKEVMDRIVSVIPTIHSLRGFYLDKNKNLIGTDGWDLFRSFIDDSYDPYKSALNRYAKS